MTEREEWDLLTSEALGLMTPRHVAAVAVFEEARTARLKCKCIFCGYVVSFDDPNGKDNLADHITTCEKSPLVQLVKQISAIGDEAMTLVRQLADSEGDREAVPELYERANELVRKWDTEEAETSEVKDR